MQTKLKTKFLLAKWVGWPIRVCTTVGETEFDFAGCFRSFFCETFFNFFRLLGAKSCQVHVFLAGLRVKVRSGMRSPIFLNHFMSCGVN